MKILFVAFPESIHTHRWVSQIENNNFKIALFPSLINHKLNENFNQIIVFEPFYLTNYFDSQPGNIYISPYFNFLKKFQSFKILKRIIYLFVRKFLKKNLADELNKVIQKFNPDIIHSLETQHSGYLVAEAKYKSTTKFPYWVHSTWGIDLHYFGTKEKHINLIKNCLSRIDHLIVEGNRDLDLARLFGYKKEISIFPSVGGGFHIFPLTSQKTSGRKVILIKGLQDECRNAICSLHAVEDNIQYLKDYKIFVYSAENLIIKYVNEIKDRTKLDIEILEYLDYKSMNELVKTARISMCTNFTDGVPNSMIEAMIYGAFPIQSDTSMANEWIINNLTGMIIPANNRKDAAEALRCALLNDNMVNSAAIINNKKVKENLDYELIKNRTILLYTQIYNTLNKYNDKRNKSISS